MNTASPHYVFACNPTASSYSPITGYSAKFYQTVKGPNQPLAACSYVLTVKAALMPSNCLRYDGGPPPGPKPNTPLTAQKSFGLIEHKNRNDALPLQDCTFRLMPELNPNTF